MSFVLPDSRFEIPALFYPGRKPGTKNLQMDWSHPLAEDMQIFSGVLFTRNIAYRNIGRGFNADGTNLVINPDASLTFDGASSARITGYQSLHSGDITIITKIKPGTVTGVQSIVGADQSNVPSRRDFQFRLNGSTFEFIPFVGNSPKTVAATSTIVANETVTVGATYDSSYSSGNNRVFVNGLFEASNSVSGSLDADGPRCTFGSRLTTEGSSTLLNYYTGVIEYVALWKRALSDLEHASFARDPYQILMPA